MSTKVGSIDLELLLNSNKFNKQLKNTKNTADNASNLISKSLSKMGKILFAAFSTTKIFDFGKDCIKLGSDLSEVQNVVDVSFKTMNESVNQFAENAIEQFGLGQTVTKKYMGTFGAMSKAFGFTEQDAFEMSKTLTGLAGDVASFYNLSSDEAYTKLKSVFTGETETLKDLGVVMTQNALDQYALANGYGKTTAKMSEQEKVALRYNFVLDQLQLASGDFVRTQDSWANQTRVLSLRFSELKATLGQGFINLFTPVIKVINTLLEKLQVLANSFKSFTEFITGNKSNNSSGIGAVASDLSSITDGADNASKAVEGIGNSAKKAAKKAKSLAAFDTAQILKTDSDNSSSSGSGASISSGGVDFGSINESAKELNLFDNISFDNLINSFQNLGDAIKYVIEGNVGLLKDFMDNFVKPLGSYVINDALPHFLNSTAEALKNTDFSKLSSALNDVWDSLLPFSENVGEGLLWFYDNILLPIGSWAVNDVVPAFLGIFAGAIDVLNKAITDIQPIFQWLWDNALSPIADWTGGVIVETLNGFGDALKWIADNEVAMSIIEGIAISIGLVAGAIGLYNIATTIGTTVTWLFNAALAVLTSPITLVVAAIALLVAGILLLVKNWDKVKEVGAKCWEGIKNAWNSAGEWFNSAIIQPISNFFSNMWNGLTNGASNAWNSIKNVFGNVANWFKNIFSNAWNAVKNVFSTGGRIFDGIKDGIASTFTSIVNKIISGINRVVSIPFNAINSALNGIRNINIAGISPFTWLPKISVPQIPMLANGGFFKANQPTLAIVGDNKRQSEIVSPMNKMEEAFENVLARNGLSSNKEIIELLKIIIQLLQNLGLNVSISLDGDELQYKLEKVKDKKDFATNGGF